MKRKVLNPTMLLALIAGLVVGLLSMIITVGLVSAAPAAQDGQPHPPTNDSACKDCHLDIAESWANSPHAHAYDDSVFQGRWAGLGNPGDCLLCHTTNYQSTTNTFSTEGVSCEACHGEVDSGHPPNVVPIRADTDYCGTCHTTTLHEWRLTGHAAANVGCTDCHDPHSQKRLFEVSDNLCINCHKDDMGAYLEDIHIKKGIGCVDCHALVIPPETPPADGIVPTGHTFTITPATCVACHTDSLHSGFHLPGYENGAKSASGTDVISSTELTSLSQDELIGIELPQAETSGLSSDQRIQALEAALASGHLMTLFQGGVIGLALGGSTAWFVSHNVRRSLGNEDSEEDEEEEEDEAE